MYFTLKHKIHPGEGDIFDDQKNSIDILCSVLLAFFLISAGTHKDAEKNEFVTEGIP